MAWSLIPFAGIVMRNRAMQREPNQLVALRVTFLALALALCTFAVAFAFIAPWDGGDERWTPWAVISLGCVSAILVNWIRRRPLDTSSAQALAASYRARFFTGAGFAESAALIGAVAMFVGGSLWLYVLGLPFSLTGFSRIAPTRDDIDRGQQEITAAGSTLSLLDALVSAPPERSGRS